MPKYEVVVRPDRHGLQEAGEFFDFIVNELDSAKMQAMVGLRAVPDLESKQTSVGKKKRGKRSAN